MQLTINHNIAGNKGINWVVCQNVLSTSLFNSTNDSFPFTSQVIFCWLKTALTQLYILLEKNVTEKLVDKIREASDCTMDLVEITVCTSNICVKGGSSTLMDTSVCKVPFWVFWVRAGFPNHAYWKDQWFKLLVLFWMWRSYWWRSRLFNQFGSET